MDRFLMKRVRIAADAETCKSGSAGEQDSVRIV
jgi:hypothetical protein